MGGIYAFARAVRIWLGPATNEEIDAVFPLLSSEADYHEILQNYEVIRSGRMRENSSSDNTSYFRLIEEFLSRAWFTRRWVLQEVILARFAIVHCGHHTISWAQLCLRTRHFGLYQGVIPRGEDGIYSIGIVPMRTLDLLSRTGSTTIPRRWETEYHCRYVTGESKVYEIILDALDNYYMSDCVDDRDRLWALCGLAADKRLYINPRDKSKLSCPVDYSLHFSHVYTDFAIAAVESGHLARIFIQTIEFGGLFQQKEEWPSWVPGWNSTGTLHGVKEIFEHYSKPRASGFPPNVHVFDRSWEYSPLDLWKEHNFRITHMYGRRALSLRACTHRIDDVKSSDCHLDTIAYFKSMLGDKGVGESCTISRSKVLWLIMLSLELLPTMLPYDRDVRCTPGPSSQQFPNNASWTALKRVLGLPSNEGTEENLDWDEGRFLRKARTILQRLYPFCYERDGSLLFGIAFVPVQPGDFVFRTTRAAGAKISYGIHLSPSVCALIIRPYHQSSSAGPSTFRIAGMCIDYFPYTKEPDIVDVVLV